MALLSFIKHLVSDKEGVKEYRETLASALRDATITNEETAELEAVSKKYGLTTEEVRRLQKAAISNVFTSMASDQRITSGCYDRRCVSRKYGLLVQPGRPTCSN